ncbi:hemicentin-1-like [Bolinopsis microptera]|uniref:hemicentin-1-like n=1 Tax=Bolinopsis microptera TaxID=2820187 RepID=UPI00307934AD
MIELLFLLTILLLQVQGTTWPTTKLIHPPSGILIEGAGRATNITFDVSGVPFPEERKWYKDGAEITTFNNMNVDESGGNLISLKFNALSKVNEGVYYFVVRESKNTLEASKSLEVRLKVSFLDDFQDSAETQTKTAQVGEFARLECRAPAHFGAYPKFSWSKGAEKIVESDSIYVSEYGDLIIMQVAFEQYSSDYRCTIKIDSLMEGEQEKQGPAVSLIVTGNAASYVPPNIALQPIDLKIDAQVKETFRVECAVNGYPTLPSIRWYKDSVQIGSSGIIYDLQNRNFLKISIPRSGGSVGGTYRCEANDGTKQIYASAEIEIQTKPIITTGLPTAEVKKSSGSTMDLSCEATSTPTPQYKWYKNANLLTNDNLNHAINGGNLSISNINSLNRGVYQCEAFNDIGSTISTGMIRVQERLTFVIRPKDVEAFLGTAATFNCQGKGDPKPTSLRWEFNGGTPPATHDYTNNLVNQATYKIPKVTSSERDGRVSCIISSPTNLYPEDTATAIVTIREGPQVKATQKNITANEGEQRDLTCMVENVGNSVNWKWLFKDTLITQDDDRRITVEHNMIEIRALTGADQGTYTCQADENGLSNSDTMFIMVKTMPRITLDDTLRIGEGADARLTCKVTSNPTPAISWIRNGQTINNSAKFTIDQPNDGTSILVVSSVDKATDIGKYACKASNELATKQSEIDLVVVAACEVMDIPKDAEADYQTTVTVSCTVNACPTAQWTWMKDGQLINFDGSRTIDRGSSIELRQVVPTDGGEYSCTVDSNNGLDNRGTYSATITVTVKAKIYGFPSLKSSSRVETQ